MKFFLAQNANFSAFTGVGEKELKEGDTTLASFAVEVSPSNILPVIKDNLEETELCTTVRHHLQDVGPSRLLCELTNVNILVGGTGAVKLFISAHHFRIGSGPLTKFLLEQFGDDVSINCAVSDFRISDVNQVANFESSEMKIGNTGDFACKSENLHCEDMSRLAMSLRTSERSAFTGLVTVTVTVDMPKGPVVTEKMEINRKMLQEEVGSDVVIIAQNGKEVKAHKSFLMTHSQVFNAMFQSDMKEAKTSTVEMPDVSEDGVRAMLAYLYCWETTEPKAKPEVALEMLQAGHKYDIAVLESAMKRLLLTKPNKWYDAEVALKLFVFAKKLSEEDGDRLKMKAIRVMKGNFESFKESTTYSALFKEDPETAKELCVHFVA